MSFLNLRKLGVFGVILALSLPSASVVAEQRHYIIRIKNGLGTQINATGEFNYDPEPADPDPNAVKTGTVDFDVISVADPSSKWAIHATITSRHHMQDNCTGGNCPSRIRAIEGSGPGSGPGLGTTMNLSDNGDLDDRIGAWELVDNSHPGVPFDSGRTHWSDTAEPVPEPPIWVLFLSGISALAWFGLRGRRMVR